VHYVREFFSLYAFFFSGCFLIFLEIIDHNEIVQKLSGIDE